MSLRDGGAVWWARDVVRVHGPEAAAYLQGQLSQDVAGLAVGGSAWSLVLQPQGKVDAFVRVLRCADDDFVLDVDEGWGEALVTRLGRFKLRTKADITPLDWRCLAVRGPAAEAALAAAGTAARADHPTWAVVADWPGLAGVDLLGPSPQPPEGVALVDAGELEVVRVEAGWPRLGAELTTDTIPAESDAVVVHSVSFTKGCYTGQELVARIDSRGGNTPRRVRGLVSPTPLQPGQLLHDNAGDEVGVVTSVATSPTLGPVGLASLRRAVEPPAVLAGGIEVRALPLVG